MGIVVRKILKGIGILVGVLIGVALLAMGAIYYITNERIDQIYEVNVSPVPVLTDAASIERGRHLVNTIGFCTECHGPDFSGDFFKDSLLTGDLHVSNLTSGKGGVGASFTHEDWVRAIRHGVGPDGKSLLTMPSMMFNHLSDEDLASIIAYLKTVPPVDKEQPPTRLGPMARIFILQAPEHFLSASAIDHDAPRPPAPEVGVNAEYGAYLAVSCQTCHGPEMAGGEMGVGAGLNLTPGGDLGNWTEADFLNTVRTGVTPAGKKLDPELMPLEMVQRLTDDELRAIWAYLQTLPPVENPPETPTP